MCYDQNATQHKMFHLCGHKYWSIMTRQYNNISTVCRKYTVKRVLTNTRIKNNKKIFASHAAA